jgi:beta-glucanase (GH16 family)
MKLGLGPSSDVEHVLRWRPGTVRRAADRRWRLRVASLLITGLLLASAAVLSELWPTSTHHHRPALSSGRAIPGGHKSVTPAVGPVGVSGRWSLIFADEFGGNALDSSKWSTGWFGSGITRAPDIYQQVCDDPAQVAVAGGVLHLTAVARPETCGGVTQPYASGLITSNHKFRFTYGAFEARIWSPGNGDRIADWPAFWSDGSSYPADGEIDAVEGLGGSPCYHFHYSGGTAGGCTTVRGAASGWHTYAADWERGSIAYYYDGHEVGHTTTGVTSAPMYLVLNLGVSSRLSPPPVAPAAMRVDYVRVWQRSS